jgi:hypothetical protein
MGITSAQLAARYWGYAAQCLIVAQRQDDSGDKRALINIARAWGALAERTRRESPDCAVAAKAVR